MLAKELVNAVVSLSTNNKIPIAIATSSRMSDVTKKQTRHQEWFRHIDTIVTRDDVLNGKPTPVNQWYCPVYFFCLYMIVHRIMYMLLSIEPIVIVFRYACAISMILCKEVILKYSMYHFGSVRQYMMSSKIKSWLIWKNTREPSTPLLGKNTKLTIELAQSFLLVFF